MTIPRSEEDLADSLPLALWRHHDVHTPRGGQFLPLYLKPDRHRRVLSDHAWTFARNPDNRGAAGVVGVPSVLPLPAQPIHFGSIGSEDTTVERFHGPAVFLSIAVDFGHEVTAEELMGRSVSQSFASKYCTCPITMSCVSGLSRSHRASAAGRRRNVPVT